MKLSTRLALPLILVSLGVTAAVTLGLLVVVQRATGAVVTQTGRQLGRIAEHAITERAQALHDVAVVFAALRGDVRARDRAWRHPALAAAAVLDRSSGAVRSSMGLALAPADAAALARGSAAAVVRAGGRLLVVGSARAEHGTDFVVVGQTLDAGFLAELKRSLQADVAIAATGATAMATFDGESPGRDVYPARVELPMPGGDQAVATVFVPAAEVFRARRTGLVVAFAGGLLLLAAALAFHAYAVTRVTRPIGDLLAATDRLAAGDLTAGLSAGAPAELGQLVRSFNRMAEELKTAQDKLVHSAKLSSVGSLVAGISHELNNPLAGLLGHAEHLHGRLPEGDPARAKLGIVINEARRMQRTLADLRGFTRPSARERGRVDLARVADDVIALAGHDAAAARVTFAADHRAAAVVTGSPDELRQVVLNLVLNAIQAMPRGGALTVRTDVAGENGGRRCRIAVSDTGTGIRPDLLAKIREPFFSTKPGRMGLGLSIAQEIVAAHAGSLTIDSREGEGTTITVLLPPEAGA